MASVQSMMTTIPGTVCRTAFASGLLLSSLVLNSCSSPPKDTGPLSTFQQEGGGIGYGGETVINTVTTNATIVSLDAVQRRIVLKYPDGRISPYAAGQEVSNFALLKVGDEVQTTVADQMGISVVKAGTLPDSRKTLSVLKGAAGSAGGSTVEVQNVTGTVQLVDYDQHAVTLQLSGGQTRTIKLMPMVDMTDVQRGSEVTVNFTEAKTFVVEKR
jgi:hypothetical protein